MTLTFLFEGNAIAFSVFALSVLFSPLIAGIERIILGGIFVLFGGLMFNTVLLAPIVIIVGSIFIITPQLSAFTGIQIILIAFLTPALSLIGFYLMGAGFVFIGLIPEWKSLVHLANMIALVGIISFFAPPFSASVVLGAIVFALFIGDSVVFGKLDRSTTPGGMIG